MDTRYSGMGVAEISSSFIEQVARDNVQEHMPGLLLEPDFGFKFKEAWDIKESARSVLLGHDKEIEHVRGNMLDLLHPKMREVFNYYGALIADDDKPTSKRQAALEEFLDFVRSEEKRLFRRGRQAYCHKHGRPCLLWDVDEGPDGALRFLVAGVTCTDVSRMNKRRMGVLGKSGIILILFLMERRFLREPLFVTECTVDQDLAICTRLLGDLYLIETLAWGPEDQGFWCNRRRRFTVFTLKVEAGGTVRRTTSLETFAAIFRRCRPAGASGEMFFAMPEMQAREVLLEVAQEQELPITEDLSWESTLPIPEQTRLQMYKVQYLGTQGFEESDIERLSPKQLDRLLARTVRKSSSGTNCNLRQTPSYMPGKTQVPCFLSRSLVFSLIARRPMLADEMLLAMGIPFFGLGGDFKTPWSGEGWDSLSEPAKVDLNGNAIHAGVMGSLIAFIMATTVRADFVAMPASLNEDIECLPDDDEEAGVISASASSGFVALESGQASKKQKTVQAT